MRTDVGGYFGYNLYDDCIYEDDLRRRLATDVTGAVNDYVCGGGDAMAIWVNSSEVREALHARAGVGRASARTAVSGPVLLKIA